MNGHWNIVAEGVADDRRVAKLVNVHFISRPGFDLDALDGGESIAARGQKFVASFAREVFRAVRAREM